MQKLITHLWFDTEAREAATWYVSFFDNSRMGQSVILENTPSGDTELITFTLAGQEIQVINDGPVFSFNPSFSMMVACDLEQELRTLHAALAENGIELMPLDNYPYKNFQVRSCTTRKRFST